MWKIPLFDIDCGKRELEEIERVISSGWLTMGPVTEQFEHVFQDFIGVKHAIAVSSCTAALHLSNCACGIGEGDEVICSALTFVAGANSILYVGAQPVFADITAYDNFNMSPVEIEKKITQKTKAIQVVHYAGYPCDMDRIKNIAERYNLTIIEDCAHAIGAHYNEKRCGAIGDAGCFSFYANKNMTTAEGGMVTTNDSRIAEKVRLMRSHGMTAMTVDRYKEPSLTYDVIELGFNYRIDEIRSAMGIVQLGKIVDNNNRRQQLVKYFCSLLDNISGIMVPFRKHHGISSYHIFPILIDEGIDRTDFMKYLKKYSIQTSIHYPAIHQLAFYQKHITKGAVSLPLTEAVAKRVVTLPLYPTMSDDDVSYVCDTIINYVKKKELS